MTDAPKSSARARGVFFLATLAVLLGSALLTAPVAYAPAQLGAFALTYALLAALLCEAGIWLGSLGPGGRLVAAVGLGLILAGHVREQVRPPNVGNALISPAGLLLFCAGGLALAILVFLLIPALSDRVTRRGALLRPAVIGLALVAVITGGFSASDRYRWHLLRHNRLLGVPAFHLLAPAGTEAERLTLGSSFGDPGVGEIGPPAGRRRVSLGQTGGASANRPNVVIILIDTLRADALAAYGGDPVVMPTINRLADDSVALTGVLATSSWTRPSVGSLFTGLQPEGHGATSWTRLLFPWCETLAEVLRSRGYETAAISANVRAVNVVGGMGQGFDTFIELPDRPYPRAGAVNRAARDFLERRRNGVADARPLLFYLHYMDPHTPYLSGAGADSERVGSIREARDNYRAELAYLDSELAKVLELIDREIGPDTRLLFTSDHGEEFGDHGQFGHGHSLYVEQLWLPVLVRTGDRQTGRFDAPLENRDLYDLVLSLVDTPGLDVTAWAERHRRVVRHASLYNRKGDASLLNRWLRPERQTVVMRRIDSGGMRLIWSAYGPTWELYDAASDPFEQVNSWRRGDPDGQRLAALLETTVEQWPRPQEITAPTGEALEQLRALGYIR